MGKGPVYMFASALWTIPLCLVKMGSVEGHFESSQVQEETAWSL